MKKEVTRLSLFALVASLAVMTGCGYSNNDHNNKNSQNNQNQEQMQPQKQMQQSDRADMHSKSGNGATGYSHNGCS